MNIWHTESKPTALMLVLQGMLRKISRGSGNPFWNCQHKPGQCAAASTNLWVNDIIIIVFQCTLLQSRYSKREVIIEVSYSCFARKIVSAVPSHRAYYGTLYIAIIGSYLNSNMTIKPVTSSRFSISVAQVDILCIALNLLAFDSL